MISKKNKIEFNPVFALKYLFVGAGIFVLPTEWAHAEYYFSPSALEQGVSGGNASFNDLSVFSKPTGQLPGVYFVEVFLNNSFVDSKELNFLNNEKGILTPELTKQQFMDWGVNPIASESLSSLPDNAEILDISKYIPDASVSVDVLNQRLSVSIPQVALKFKPRGYVSPEYWDSGINALTFNYMLSGSSSHADGGASSNSQYLSLRTGVNINGWFFRNNSSYARSNGEENWSSLNTYVTRNIPSIKSVLTLGEYSTSGKILNSVPYTGVSLASDVLMLPPSQRGFAPMIRGVASSNSRVTVRQNGYIVYETYVATGPFEISDLYPTVGNGDLEVTVEGLNGSIEKFEVPFSSLAIMQREGQYDYTITLAKYRDKYVSSSGIRKENPYFLEATLEYGLKHGITVYGGGVLSKDYQSLVAGTGFNLGAYGAISGGVTLSSAKFKDDFRGSETKKGQSYNISYSKTLNDIGSSVTLGAYRYSTESYYDFDEFNNISSLDTFVSNKKSRFQLLLNQQIGKYSSLYFNAYQQNFWGGSQKDQTYNVGLYTTLYDIYALSLDYSYTRSSYAMGDYTGKNSTLFMSLSIPLDWRYASRLSASYSGSDAGSRIQNVSVSGSALDNNLNYSAQLRNSNQGQGTSADIFANYNASKIRINAGYGRTNSSSRVSYGVSGGVVLYQGGLVFAPSLNETAIIVKAEGASDVNVRGYSNLKTDSHGNAIIPYANPYQRNEISLDVSTLEGSVDILNNAAVVVPTRGAIVEAKIDARVGMRAIFRVTHDGKPVPYGAVALLENMEQAVSYEKTQASAEPGIVSDGGEVFLSGLKALGTVAVEWGNRSDQRCVFTYDFSDKSAEIGTLHEYAVDCK